MSSTRFKDCALLLIDLQTQWTKPCINGDFPDLAVNTKKLVKFARQNGMLVVHIYADYNKEDSLWFDVNDERLDTLRLVNNPPDLDIVKPLQVEKIIHKSTFDGFYKTTLDEYLKSKGISTIYGAGVATLVCVLNTMHGAFIRGYKLNLVKDCCGDSNLNYHDSVSRYYYMFNITNINDNLQPKKSKL